MDGRLSSYTLIALSSYQARNPSLFSLKFSQSILRVFIRQSAHMQRQLLLESIAEVVPWIEPRDVVAYAHELHLAAKLKQTMEGRKYKQYALPMIIDEATKDAAVVDPVEPHKVLRVAQENGVNLKLVLTTHHHWDHAGGNDKMKQLMPEIKIFGGSVDNVQGCTNKVENGDKLSLGADIDILSLHTPCHTKGHISYYVTGKEGKDPAVFTGDTLFIAGCGKFFEGTAEQMYQSLCVTLASLPKPTQVYCGHEYTVKNLQFASTVEPDNAKISQKLLWAEQKRRNGLPTVPSTIEEELETNPFMRVDLPEVQEKVGCKSPVEALREIRQRKDNWRG